MNFNIENLDVENFSQYQGDLWMKFEFAFELKKLINNENNDLIECYEDELGEYELEIYNLHIENGDTDSKYKSYINKLNDYTNSLIYFSKVHNIYFFLCVYDTYEATLNDRLIKYLDNEIEVNAQDFHIEEFKKILSDYETIEIEKIAYPQLKSTLEKSKNKKLNLLTHKLDELGIYAHMGENEISHLSLLKTKVEFIDKTNKAKSSENSNTKFYGSQIEFIELIKALIENGNLKGTQKDIIEICKAFFDIEINHPEKTISDINKRNNGSETLFLDKLKYSLNNYIQHKNR